MGVLHTVVYRVSDKARRSSELLNSYRGIDVRLGRTDSMSPGMLTEIEQYGLLTSGRITRGRSAASCILTCWISRLRKPPEVLLLDQPALEAELPHRVIAKTQSVIRDLDFRMAAISCKLDFPIIVEEFD